VKIHPNERGGPIWARGGWTLGNLTTLEYDACGKPPEAASERKERAGGGERPPNWSLRPAELEGVWGGSG